MPKVHRKKPNILFFLSILALLGFIIWNYRSTWIVSQLTLVTLGEGEVRHESPVKAVFANTEILITAPIEGKLSLVQEDGQRFRKGETIAGMVPTGIDYTSPQKESLIQAPISGLFYAYLDGLEQVVTPENLMNMELAGLIGQAESSGAAVAETDENSMEGEAENGVEAETVDQVIGKDAPVGKMVNNLYPSWMFVHLDQIDTLKKDNIVRFIVGGEEYAGTVMKVSAEPRGAIVRFSQYIKGTTKNRVQEVTWKFQPVTSGLVVPLGVLCTYGEERGVYIAERGVIIFKNIQVVDSNETSACISGLPAGTSIVTNPREGIAGLPIKM